MTIDSGPQPPKRLVLKGPPHTCRVKTLLEMFPDALFVHIVRDPYTVFPSTVHTWKRLYKYHGAQVPRYEDIEEHVFETFNHMYEVFQQDRELIADSRLCEVRYEDLVRDPIGQMRMLYEHLGLGEFELVLPMLRRYVSKTADYRTNRYSISPDVHRQVTQRWHGYIERYGYGPRAASAAG